jgi:uncharacterized coiled-coil DUF342 family protein
MIYRNVRVGKTRSYGMYQNASVTLDAELEEGEQPDQVVKQLNEKVEQSLDQIIQAEHVAELNQGIKELEARRDELNEEINKLADKLYLMRDVLPRLAAIANLVKDIEETQNKGDGPDE